MITNRHDQLAALKHLDEGRSPAFVARALGDGVTAAEVTELGEEWGWPDPNRLGYGIAELVKWIREDEVAELGTGSVLDSAAQVMQIARPAAAPAAQKAAHRKGCDDQVVGLLARADKVTGPDAKRVTSAASRVRAAVQQLEAALTEMETRRRAQARQAAQAAGARAEVERLERELAAARAKLRTRAKSSTRSGSGSSGRRTTSASGVRAWARANGVPCSAHGRVPAAVQERYQAAQRQAQAS